MTQAKPSSLRRRQQTLVEFAHGWGRRGDATESVGMSAAGRHRRAPAGTSLLLLVIVGVFTALGIARVHASTRVLGFGAQITDLTQEQARLLDKRRRLGAERAYLRHPDQIGEVARDRLGMIPMSPDVTQSIRLKEAAAAPGEDR